MEAYQGLISAFGFNFAPRDWAYCDGTQIAIAQNQALFSLLGTIYGGDGRVTFSLPDLRGRHPVSFGHGPGLTNYPIGIQAGAEVRTLGADQVPLPTHAHTAQFTPTTAGGSAEVLVSTNPTASKKTPGNGDYLAAQKTLGGVDVFAPGTSTPTSSIALGGVSGGGGGTVTVDPADSTAHSPVDLRTPLLAVNFCIVMNGLYPSRN